MTSAKSRRDLLKEVAEGRLSPDDAAAALADLDAGSAEPAAATAPREPGDVWGDVTDSPQSPPQPTAAVPATAEPRTVRIRAVGQRVRVTGEPSIATVSVDGPHVVRRDADTVTVASEGEFGSSLDGFALMRSRSVNDLRDRLLGFGRELSVRVNPELSVDVEVTAGSLTVQRVPQLAKVRVTAGSARILDADSPLDLLVQAGSAKVEAKPTRGASRLRVESGSLDVRLRSGADVRVHSDAQAGRVSWSGTHHRGGAQEVVVGSGAGVLSLEAVMGSISVRTD